MNSSFVNAVSGISPQSVISGSRISFVPQPHRKFVPMFPGKHSRRQKWVVAGALLCAVIPLAAQHTLSLKAGLQQTWEWKSAYSVRPDVNTGWQLNPMISLNRESAKGSFTEFGIHSLGFGNYKGLILTPDSLDQPVSSPAVRTGYLKLGARFEAGNTSWGSRNGKWRFQYAAAALPSLQRSRVLAPDGSIPASVNTDAGLRLEGIARLQHRFKEGFGFELSLPVSMVDLQYSARRTEGAGNSPVRTFDFYVLPGRTGLRTSLVWQF